MKNNFIYVMSILDDNLDISIEDIYTTKIANFFKKNGPLGFGMFGVSTYDSIETKYLFQVYNFYEVMENPGLYILCYARVGSKFFLKIYNFRDRGERFGLGGYAVVHKRIKNPGYIDNTTLVYIKDII